MSGGNEHVLVTGITGHVGGATARRLLETGKQVRALVRDEVKAAAWKDKGVELSTANGKTQLRWRGLDGVEGRI